MKRPPIASSGANAIACSTPSTPPHLSRSESATADRSESLLTSSSSTSTGSGSRCAQVRLGGRVGELRPLELGIPGDAKLPAMDDPDGGTGAHDPELGTRPRQH